MGKHSDKIKEGLRRAKARGIPLGRPPSVMDATIESVMHLSTSIALRHVPLCRAQYLVRRKAILARKEEVGQ